MRASASSLLLLLAVVLPAAAAAAVTQPNGLVVPQPAPGGEVDLQVYFDAQGESIDAVADASETPNTFLPLVGFTGTFVLNEAGAVLGIGWYDSDPAATEPPSAEDVHEIVAPGSPVGTVVDTADILDHPEYGGGRIGFALVGVDGHFSESRFNTVCDTGDCAATPGPWILSLSYASTVQDDAWYLAFEDGGVSADGWSNDGDYNDQVFLFVGLRGAEPGDDDDSGPDDDDSGSDDDDSGPDDDDSGPDDDDSESDDDDLLPPGDDDDSTVADCACGSSVAGSGSAGLLALALLAGGGRRRDRTPLARGR